MHDPQGQRIYLAGSVAAGVQALGVVALVLIGLVLGDRPDTAADVFAIHGQGVAHLLLRGDLPVVVLVILPALLSWPALALGMRREAPMAAWICAVAGVVSVACAVSADSTLSLVHLAGQFEAATSDLQRAQVIAATDAVLATDLWHGTAGYLGGFLMQGPALVLCWVMIRCPRFTLVTALTGVAANGIDLVQHALLPVLPAVSAVLQVVMGVFYLVWFPMLARDLWLLSQRPTPP